MTPAPTRRWLIGSLILNVFLLGAVAGALGLAGRHGPPPFGGGRPGGPMAGLRGVEQNLSPQGQQQVREFFERDQPAMREHLSAFRAQRQAIEAAFNAEPFDAATAETAFAALRTHEAEMARTVQARLIALAQTLSPEDRRHFAAGMGRLPSPPGALPFMPPGRAAGMPPPMPQGNALPTSGDAPQGAKND